MIIIEKIEKCAQNLDYKNALIQVLVPLQIQLCAQTIQIRNSTDKMKVSSLLVSSTLLLVVISITFTTVSGGSAARRILAQLITLCLARGRKVIIPLPLPIPIPYTVKNTKHEYIHKGMEEYPVHVAHHGHTNIHIDGEGGEGGNSDGGDGGGDGGSGGSGGYRRRRR